MFRCPCWLIVVLLRAACGPTWAEPDASNIPAAAPRPCAAASSGNIESLARTYGISPEQLDIPAHRADAQARRYPGEVCLDQALAAALHSLFHDRDDADSAASMLDRYGRDFARHPQSKLRLAQTHQQPPRGEHIARAWLFVFSMPALSDHQYWAVVLRRPDHHGSLVAYSYGFN